MLDATAGFGSFAVTSSVQGISDSDNEDLLSTTNFEDDFFEASYVPEGGITQNPDGSLSIGALIGDANFMAITLGVAFRPFVGWTEDDDHP